MGITIKYLVCQTRVNGNMVRHKGVFDMKDTNLSTKVYKDIKNMLITLIFPPGSSLQERVLAGMLGVSRTPIREALQRLSHEGWVQMGDRKRIFVSPVNIADIDEIFQLRHILEPCAARAAIDKGKVRTLAGKLDEVLNVMEQVQNDNIAFGRLDMQFHSLLMQNLENERMHRFWITLHEETSRIAIMNLSKDNRSISVMEEHGRMVEAFWEKDPEQIMDAIANHLLKSRDALVARLEEADWVLPQNPPELGSEDTNIYAIPEFRCDPDMSALKESVSEIKKGGIGS